MVIDILDLIEREEAQEKSVLHALANPENDWDSVQLFRGQIKQIRKNIRHFKQMASQQNA